MLGRAWFLRRFLDPGARFFFVGVDQVGAAAVELEAVALSDPEGLILPSALADLEERLAGGNLPLRNFMRIVAAAGAAVGEGEAAPPEAAGLEALVEGLRCLPVGAGARLERGIELCDALYAWLRRRDRDGGEAGDRP
jgi:hypothetical protein